MTDSNSKALESRISGVEDEGEDTQQHRDRQCTHQELNHHSRNVINGETDIMTVVETHYVGRAGAGKELAKLTSKSPVGSHSSSNGKPSRKRENNMRKAPQAPKRFKSSYIFFFTTKQQQIKDELGPNSTVSDVSKRSAELWREIPAEERSYWEEVATRDKQRYVDEKAAYTGPWYIPWKRVKKDPSAPKRPMSAFLYYSQARRKEIREKNLGKPNTEISRILGTMWREASDIERQPYVVHEEKEREKYKIVMVKWRKSNTDNKLSEKKRQEASHTEQQLLWTQEQESLQQQPQHFEQLQQSSMMWNHHLQSQSPNQYQGGPSVMYPYSNITCQEHQRWELPSIPQGPYSMTDVLHQDQHLVEVHVTTPTCMGTYCDKDTGMPITSSQQQDINSQRTSRHVILQPNGMPVKCQPATPQMQTHNPVLSQGFDLDVTYPMHQGQQLLPSTRSIQQQWHRTTHQTQEELSTLASSNSSSCSLQNADFSSLNSPRQENFHLLQQYN